MIHFVFYTDWLIPTRFHGFTFGPLILIRTTRKGDVGLLEHEKVHVKQFWSNPLFGLWYLFSKKARYAYELEAYRVSLHHNPERLYSYANALATKYGLNLPIEQVIADLTA